MLPGVLLFIIVIFFLYSGDDPVALALAVAEVCPLDYTTKASSNPPYKGKELSKTFTVQIYTCSQQHRLCFLLYIVHTATEIGPSSDASDIFDHETERKERDHSKQSRSSNPTSPSLTSTSTTRIMFLIVYIEFYIYICTLFMIVYRNNMPGPKNITREERKGRKKEEEDKRKQENRPSSATRQGMDSKQDYTILSSDEDEQPSAKISKPKGGGFREAITRAYNKKVEETKNKRVADGKLRADDDLNVQKVGTSVDAPTDGLLAPVKHADASTISLRDLLPEGYKDEAEDGEEFKLSRIDFMILYRKVASHASEDAMD